MIAEHGVDCKLMLVFHIERGRSRMFTAGIGLVLAIKFWTCH